MKMDMHWTSRLRDGGRDAARRLGTVRAPRDERRATTTEINPWRVSRAGSGVGGRW